MVDERETNRHLRRRASFTVNGRPATLTERFGLLLAGGFFAVIMLLMLSPFLVVGGLIVGIIVVLITIIMVLTVGTLVLGAIVAVIQEMWGALWRRAR